MRAVVFVHRWLGILCGPLFVVWFASGIVMMYARMPELSRSERRAHQPPLALAAVQVSPVRAALGLIPESFRIQTLLGRPVFRIVSRGETMTMFADTGERFGGLTVDQAVDEARRFAPAQAAAARYIGRLVEPDQWTLESRGMLPLHHVALGDAAGTELYLSERTGEVVLSTDARERRAAYAGAVLHWLYFTPLRRNGALWAQVVIGLSLAGSAMCLLGLVWGWFGVSARYHSPYRGWMRWHHYSGLAFGFVTFTWVFSGLLSMDPWDWHPTTTPARAQRDAFSGGALRLDRVQLGALTAPELKEIEVGQFDAQPFLVFDGRAEGAREPDALLAAARRAMPGAGVADAVWLARYDAYYYDRNRELPLPVLRVRFEDPSRTWLYIDPRRGTPVRQEVRLTRLNRWIYHGLHSLDFPGFYYKRPLWDLVVILLSVGGLASIVTAAVPAWRRLRRTARRLL